VVGSERIREWEGKDGGKGQSLELRARDVGVIPKAPREQSGGFGNDDGGWGSNNDPGF
jgi:single-stranded DNA-binding protein